MNDGDWMQTEDIGGGSFQTVMVVLMAAATAATIIFMIAWTVTHP